MNSAKNANDFISLRFKFLAAVTIKEWEPCDLLAS